MLPIRQRMVQTAKERAKSQRKSKKEIEKRSFLCYNILEYLKYDFAICFSAHTVRAERYNQTAATAARRKDKDNETEP